MTNIFNISLLVPDIKSYALICFLSKSAWEYETIPPKSTLIFNHLSTNYVSLAFCFITKPTTNHLGIILLLCYATRVTITNQMWTFLAISQFFIQGNKQNYAMSFYQLANFSVTIANKISSVFLHNKWERTIFEELFLFTGKVLWMRNTKG